MYNVVCGNNPLFGLFARILETEAPLPPVPRWRDLYTDLQDGQPVIVIYTRTGGDNGSAYIAENLALTEHPLFLSTEDDNFDSTFALFTYRCPERFCVQLRTLHDAFSKFYKGWPSWRKFQYQLAHLKKEPTDEPTGTDEDAEVLELVVSVLISDLPNSSSLELAVAEYTKLKEFGT